MTIDTTKQTPGAVVGFVDDLNAAIRENPVAAGLVGMGVLWMFFGAPRASIFANVLPNTTSAVKNAVGAGIGAVGDAVSSTGSRVSDAVGSLGNTISSTASTGYEAVKAKGESVTGTLSHAASDTGRVTTEFSRHLGTSVQQNLSKTLEAQPLLLGALGIAIGAGIASALPATKVEQEMMGEAGAVLKERIQDIATETSARAKEVIAEAKKEATAQGLGLDAAGEALKGVVQKIKTTASTSQESFKSRLT